MSNLSILEVQLYRNIQENQEDLRKKTPLKSIGQKDYRPSNMCELTTYFSSNITEKVKGMFLYYDGRAITLVIASNLFCYGAGWVLSPDFHVG